MRCLSLAVDRRWFVGVEGVSLMQKKPSALAVWLAALFCVACVALALAIIMAARP